MSSRSAIRLAKTGKSLFSLKNPLGKATSGSQVDEQHQRLADQICLYFYEDSGGVGLFLVELPGLLEIAEVFGDETKYGLLRHAIDSLILQFGHASVSAVAEHRLAVICKGVSEQQVAWIAAKIQTCIGCCRSASGVMIVGTPSVGVALLQAVLPELREDLLASVETMIRHAELALHQTSPGHANSVQLYTDALDRTLRDATRLRQNLLRAIDQKEFFLDYQPIVDLRSNRTTGLEALIRWRLPCGGPSASPATFISAAERTGLIVAIGTQVLDNAMRQASQWGQGGHATPRIAVNVSGQQLLDPEFLSIVEGSLDRAGLSPTILELELTERTLIASSANTIRGLESLQRLGVTISVDDFGTGYSSLRYLQDLPISKLKIDQSFIWRLTNGAKERAMVQTMISLADNFELGVVAEGIETPEQLAILRSMGCSHGQGYLFSRPMAAGDVQACFDHDWSAISAA